MRKLLVLGALFLSFTAMGEAKADTCVVKLKKAYSGYSLETFYGYGWNMADACRDALRDCNRTLRAGYYRERGLRCETMTRVVRPAPRPTPPRRPLPPRHPRNPRRRH